MSEAWSQYAVTAFIAKIKEKAGSSVILLDCLGAEIFKNRSILHELNATQAPQDLPIDQWISEFKSIFSEQHESSEIAVPLIILNAALGERSITSRLLLSVTAIEAIAGKRKERTKEELKIIKDLRANVEKSSLGDAQKKSLLDAMIDLKRNQISKTCCNLVNEVLGKEYEEKFSKLYNIRSRLVHEGKQYSMDELHEQANVALIIARELVNAKIIRH